LSHFSGSSSSSGSAYRRSGTAMGGCFSLGSSSRCSGSLAHSCGPPARRRTDSRTQTRLSPPRSSRTNPGERPRNAWRMPAPSAGGSRDAFGVQFVSDVGDAASSATPPTSPTSCTGVRPPRDVARQRRHAITRAARTRSSRWNSDCRAPSTGTVNEAHRHEEKARFPHSTARGLAARRRTSRKGRRLGCGGGRDPWQERGVDLLRPMWRLPWREGETASSL